MQEQHLQRQEAVIRECCLRPENRFGADFLEQHILLNRDFCLRLAPVLGAELKIVLPAALLHDIAAVRDFSCLPVHAQAGAVQAAQILQDMGYAPDDIDRICRCIETHSSPLAAGEASAEAVCLSNADAMTQLARPAYWFYYVYQVHGKSCADGVEWYRSRLASHLAALIAPAREMISAEITRLEDILAQ